MFDGLALQGLLSPPRYIRDHIQAEQEVYTTAHPPRFFGHGSISKS
jgi:spermidine synthase